MRIIIEKLDLIKIFKNLYVADGSVLPKAPGLPPVYTILALHFEIFAIFPFFVIYYFQL